MRGLGRECLWDVYGHCPPYCMLEIVLLILQRRGRDKDWCWRFKGCFQPDLRASHGSASFPGSLLASILDDMSTQRFSRHLGRLSEMRNDEVSTLCTIPVAQVLLEVLIRRFLASLPTVATPCGQHMMHAVELQTYMYLVEMAASRWKQIVS